MAIAFFDLDKTLLASDSDYAWASFLQQQGIIQDRSFSQKIAQFDHDYNQGQLDMHAYCFAMISPLMPYSQDQIKRLLDAYLSSSMCPAVFPDGLRKLKFHQSQGDIIVIVTATINYVAKRFADKLGIEHLLATTPIYANEFLTGKIENPACYQQGKVEYVRKWLEKHNHSLIGSFFYTDSINDLPLLNYVDHPVVVNPDLKLSKYAKDRDWVILNWLL